MAYNDPQYQINDLMNRVKVLETQAKASTKQAVPQSPLYAATSTGQGIAGVGVSQDAQSRAVTTAVQAALAGVESLQFVFLGVNSFSHAVATQTLGSVHVRPDPVVGEVYRWTGGGLFINGSAGPTTMQLGLTMNLAGFGIINTGGTVVNNGTSQPFYFTALMTVNAAGPTGRVQVISMAVIGSPGTAFAKSFAFNPVNLVSPTFDVQSISSVSDPLITTEVDGLTLESLGFRQG